MVEEAFASKKSYEKRLRAVIPVVAEAFPVNESTIVPPQGIEDLIKKTNELMPEGIKAGRNDLNDFVLSRKRAMVHSIIFSSTVAGAAVGALPLPIADAAVLGAVETAEVGAIAGVYGIKDDDDSKQLIDTIVNVGTVSVAAKGAISMLKTIPGINIAAEVLNAGVAGSIVAAMGLGSAYAFERIYIGEKEASDLEWVQMFMEQQLESDFIKKATAAIEALDGELEPRSIANAIATFFVEPTTDSDQKKLAEAGNE